MNLTNRDLEIFKLMTKTTILTTAQLKKYVFQGVAVTTILRRLRKLEKEKFIERTEGLPNHELAWHLTLKGADAVGYVNPKRYFHRLSLVHDVKLTGLRLTLESSRIAHSWLPEHEIRSAMARKHGVKRMQSQSVPDGIMGIKYNSVMESVLVELELHYKNKSRYQNIFQSYQWKKNVKAIWYLVPSESLGRHLEKLWLKYVGKVGPWFLWSLVDDVLENHGQATLHYFDKSFEIGKLFEPREEQSLPAHTSGSGVSNQAKYFSPEKINLTPRSESESLENVS